jgi:hypothetical protein
MVIRWLEQTEEMVMKVLTKNGLALQYVKNPSRLHIETAIKQNGCAIEFVDNPSMELEELAVSSNPEAIGVLIRKWQDIKKLTRDQSQFTKKLKFLAIQRNPELIDSIPGLSSKDVRNWVNELRRRAVRTSLCEVCIGLQPLELPALMTMMILDELNFPHMNLMTDHAKWEVITMVKHFK